MNNWDFIVNGHIKAVNVLFNLLADLGGDGVWMLRSGYLAAYMAQMT